MWFCYVFFKRTNIWEKVISFELFLKKKNMSIFNFFVLLLLVVTLADFTFGQYYEYGGYGEYAYEYEDEIEQTLPFNDGVEVPT